MKKLILTNMLLVATAVSALAAPVTTVKTANGAVLAGENGMTLYTFAKDGKGVSNCYDACATNWPPLKAGASAKASGDYTVIKRKDGSMQWARNGKPLYFWINDAKKGDTTGDGVKGVWHVARP